jgi:hypothetical protein
VGYFGPLKDVYLQEVGNWLVTNSGASVSTRHVAGLFRAAYIITVTSERPKMPSKLIEINHLTPNIISDGNFEQSMIICKNMMRDDNLERNKC